MFDFSFDGDCDGDDGDLGDHGAPNANKKAYHHHNQLLHPVCTL